MLQLLQYPQAYNDIALIRLKEKLSLTGTIRKICLPLRTNNEPNQLYGHSIHLVGYGAIRSDATNPLRSAKLDIVPHTYCINQHNKGKIFHLFDRQIKRNFPQTPMIKSNQICAGVDGISADAGSCAGDSGSPAIKKDYVRNAFYQVAVLHGSVGSCSAAVFPTVYTRLNDPEILEFVTKSINGIPVTTKVATTTTNIDGNFKTF